jgi:transposase-like protein
MDTETRKEYKNNDPRQNRQGWFLSQAIGSAVMQTIDSLLCPYCGQDNQVPVETSIQVQRFITDCEVCCRPFEVIAECDSGEVVSLEAVTG